MMATTGILIEQVIASIRVKEDIVPPFAVLEGFVALVMWAKMEIVPIQQWMLSEELTQIHLGNIFA